MRKEKTRRKSNQRLYEHPYGEDSFTSGKGHSERQRTNRVKERRTSKKYSLEQYIEQEELQW